MRAAGAKNVDYQSKSNQTYLRGGSVKENRTFSYTKSPQGEAAEFCPRRSCWRDSSLPLRRKEVRCTRWPFARGMPPSNRMMLRCPPSAPPPDCAVLPLRHTLPVLSLHLPLPERPQSPWLAAKRAAQDCSLTHSPQLPASIWELESFRKLPFD